MENIANGVTTFADMQTLLLGIIALVLFAIGLAIRNSLRSDGIRQLAETDRQRADTEILVALTKRGLDADERVDRLEARHTTERLQDAQRIGALQYQIDELKTQRETDQITIVEQRKRIDDMQTDLTQAEAALKENEALKLDVQSMRNELQKLSEQVAKMEKELTTIKQERDDALKEAEDLRRRNEALERENTELKRLLQEIKPADASATDSPSTHPD